MRCDPSGDQATPLWLPVPPGISSRRTLPSAAASQIRAVPAMLLPRSFIRQMNAIRAAGRGLAVGDGDGAMVGPAVGLATATGAVGTGTGGTSEGSLTRPEPAATAPPTSSRAPAASSQVRPGPRRVREPAGPLRVPSTPGARWPVDSIAAVTDGIRSAGAPGPARWASIFSMRASVSWRRDWSVIAGPPLRRQAPAGVLHGRRAGAT